MQKVILSHSLTIARPSKVLIHCLHYKLLAETMHDVSNDLVPSNLKEVFCTYSKSTFLQYSIISFKEFLYQKIKSWDQTTVEWATNKASDATKNKI